MAFGTNKIFTSNANELKKELIMQDLIKKNGAYIHDRAKTAIADASIAHITKTKIFNSNFELINKKVNQLNFDIFAITLQKKSELKILIIFIIYPLILNFLMESMGIIKIIILKIQSI